MINNIFANYSIERDAQLLANRIALLKQEEMKTWKKIEETKKRTNDITGLKKRNEEKVQKVSVNKKYKFYIIFRKYSIFKWRMSKKGK